MKPLRKLWSAGGGASVMAGAALCLALLANGVTREVPLGNMEGTVTMQENGRPLPGATVIIRREFEHEGLPKSRVFTVREDGRFSLKNIPAGAYTIEAQARAHSMEETRVVISEGQPTPLDLELKPSDPYLELSASQHVYTPEEEPSVLLSGFVKESEASVRIYKATEAQVLKANGIYNAFQPLSRWSEAADPDATLGKPVRTVAHEIKTKDAEGVFTDAIDLESLPTGIYWVECQAGGKTRGTYLNITNLSLITKSVGKEVLCFATDIKSGKPVQDVTVGYAKAGALAVKGTTDAEGVARFNFEVAPGSNDILVAAKKDGSSAFVNFYSPDTHQGNGFKIFTYTDRPVYRPGDEVKFKGIVRRLVGNGFVLPQSGSAEVKVLDSEDSLLWNDTLTLSEMGSCSGSYRFNREAPPGFYKIVTTYGGSEETHQFEIAAYRKPEFTVRVTPAKKFYVRGDRARALVQCDYYFGGPVVGAKVNVTIARSTYWSWQSEEGEEVYTEPDESGGEYVESIEAVTDGKGQAVIDFETMIEGDPEKASDDMLYTLRASVEEGDKYFDGTGTVKVTRGEFGVEVQTDRYVVSQGATVEAEVAAAWHDGDRPASGRRIRVTMGEQVWDGNTSEFHPLGSVTVTTGADGKAKAQLKPPKTGSITIRAIAEDDRGNEIEGESWLWVDGEGAAASAGPIPKMKLELDKKTYNIGDTAKVLVQAEKPGGAAILTIEGDRIYSSQVVHLNKNTKVVDVPVIAQHAPNAYVTIAYVNDKKYVEASDRLSVQMGARKLQVRVTSDKPDYKPGETATYTIKTLNDQGNPVPAEVSVGVVDESIYAIREDSTNILNGFYPMRENSVQTAYSFPELYLDGGDKTPADIQVRSKFLDTAFWQPSVMTDESGTATIQVPLPDNLTSWRTTVVAASADTAVGQATLNVRARKDLMIRLQTPTFMVQGDTQVLTATINNDTGKDVDVNYELQVDGMTVVGDPRDSVSVDAGEPATLEWTVKATRTGPATFVAKAWIDGGDSDGVRHTVPVQPHGRLVVEQSAGEITGNTRIKFAVRPGADTNTGRMIITLSPSLASSLVQSLDGLIDYPYGCVEQTMSRFLPAVLVSQTLDAMGLPPTPRAVEIPQIVREGYQRLKNMRGYKGGWGWWDTDEPDPYMTAYVLEGMRRAAQAGYPDDTISVDTALEWATTALKGKDAAKWDRSSRLYLSYVLAFYGRTDAAAAFLARENLSQATSSELAMAVLAYEAAGDAATAGELVRRLMSQATIGAATAHWPEEWYGYETTARALQAILAADPKNPAIPKIVRYLIRARKGDTWMSTRDSSISLIALTQYLKTAQAAVQPSEIVVSLNGTEVRRVRFDKSSLYDPDLRVEIPISKMRQGDNELELATSGGTAFYGSDLRQTVVQQRLGQLVSGQGLTIERRYYALEPKKMEDGTMRLMQSSDVIREIESGQPVRCVLTIQAQKAQEYIMIEDPIPSNCRVMERGAATYDSEWDWWFTQMAILDDKITFFARTVPAGTHTIEYTIRAESPGVARALPVVLSNMYDPAIRASSAENQIEVTAK